MDLSGTGQWRGLGGSGVEEVTLGAGVQVAALFKLVWVYSVLEPLALQVCTSPSPS